MKRYPVVDLPSCRDVITVQLPEEKVISRRRTFHFVVYEDSDLFGNKQAARRGRAPYQRKAVSQSIANGLMKKMLDEGENYRSVCQPAGYEHVRSF